MKTFPTIQPNRPFRFHPACEDKSICIALRVTESSAVVRSTARKHEEFTVNGKPVSFDKPLGNFTISPTAQVFYLDEEER